MAQVPRALDPTASALHQFGAELRHWRELRGTSLAALGRKVYVSGDLLGKIEKAERWPSEELTVLCDSVLCTGGVLTRRWRALGRERPTASMIAVGYPRSACDAAAGVGKLVGAEAGGRGQAVSSTFRADGFAVASRDWLLARAVEPRTIARDVRRASIDDARRLRQAFALFQERDTKAGGASTRGPLVRFLHTEAVPLLHTSHTDAVHGEIFAASAELAYLAGLTAADSGACGLGQRYFVLALRLAQEAEDDAFAANVLAAMAHLAAAHGNGREAIQLATTGLAGARRAACQPVAMRLYMALARGQALDGYERSAVDALRAAEQVLERWTPGDDPFWTRFLDHAYLLGEAAQCFLDLDQPEDAERMAEQSIKASGMRARRRALAQAALATARARQGEDEAAQAAFSDALATIGNVRSSRTLRAVRGVAAAAAPLRTPVSEQIVAIAAGVTGVRSAKRCCPVVDVASVLDDRATI